MNQCLIIVDVQKDFCPGGALACKGGDDIVPVINQISAKFKHVVASKDWHPATTVHFDKWPVHCVRGSDGAAYHDGLEVTGIDEVLLKGTGNTDDGYSAFEATNLDLNYWLKKNRIEKIYICGIATEYCVKATAMDARKTGCEVFVITDAIAGVAAAPNDRDKALSEMEAAGINIISSRDL